MHKTIPSTVTAIKNPWLSTVIRYCQILLTRVIGYLARYECRMLTQLFIQCFCYKYPVNLDEFKPYSKEQEKRHEVKPGITGWAQVNGRNAISWKQKFEYDLWYIQHQSFILDIKILGMTLTKVFITKDVNATGQTTMEPFNGNN